MSAWCEQCRNWQRFTMKRGYCRSTIVKSGARVGFLVTRFSDHCDEHKPRGELLTDDGAIKAMGTGTCQ